MAKKKTPAGPARPAAPQGRGGVSTHVYLDPAVAAALAEYLASAQPRTSKTAVIELALREFFQSRGAWPGKEG
jgi:hypothetical protein